MTKVAASKEGAVVSKYLVYVVFIVLITCTEPLIEQIRMSPIIKEYGKYVKYAKISNTSCLRKRPRQF